MASYPASHALASAASSARALSRRCPNPPQARSELSKQVAEASNYRISFQEAQALRTLDDKPLAVVTASGSLADTAGWTAAQAKLATLSTNARHVVAVTSHAGMLEDRVGAEQSVDAIDAAVRSVRNQTPISR